MATTSIWMGSSTTMGTFTNIVAPAGVYNVEPDATSNASGEIAGTYWDATGTTGGI